MTFKRVFDSNGLFCKNNLTYDETVKRLKKYFSKQEITDIMISVDTNISWTDGSIVVICTDKNDKKYSIIASSVYNDLIEE